MHVMLILAAHQTFKSRDTHGSMRRPCVLPLNLEPNSAPNAFSLNVKAMGSLTNEASGTKCLAATRYR